LCPQGRLILISLINGIARTRSGDLNFNKLEFKDAGCCTVGKLEAVFVKQISIWISFEGDDDSEGAWIKVRKSRQDAHWITYLETLLPHTGYPVPLRIPRHHLCPALGFDLPGSLSAFASFGSPFEVRKVRKRSLQLSQLSMCSCSLRANSTEPRIKPRTLSSVMCFVMTCKPQRIVPAA